MAEPAAEGCGGRLGLKLLTGRWFHGIQLSYNNGSERVGLHVRAVLEPHKISNFGYDQRALNLLSFSKDLGDNLGLFSGLLYEVASPWLILSVGAAMNFSGRRSLAGPPCRSCGGCAFTWPLLLTPCLFPTRRRWLLALPISLKIVAAFWAFSKGE